jgi:cyclohexadieny/prephenate dehydrogenase
MQVATLTIVGVGLLGGSIGLAAKERKLARRVVGVGRSRERLEPARVRGIIDEISLDLSAAAAESDLMVFCTPVDQIVRQIQIAAGACKTSCLLTDVGSTKRHIVETIENSAKNPDAFVGSHPLAGSEKQGWEFAQANLFQGRTVVVTVTARTAVSALAQIKEFWRTLGAVVVEMDPGEHDRILAQTSHLPHLTASALAASMNLKTEQLMLAATGLRDTTRIAAGDPDLWAAILLENRREVRAALASFRHTLDLWQAALEKADRGAIESLLEQGKQFRDALGN